MESTRNVELLAPAGSLESVKAAYAAGADAVYAGGTRFGARAYAQNLTERELLEAIDFAHLHDRRFYLTVNTLLKETELEEQLFSYLQPLYTAGLDAVIIQDLGVLAFVREAFPELSVHASTQMTLSGVRSVKLLEEMGVSRVVTPRELSLSEIAEIRSKTEVEIESFVHGALCYCYSGQCLLSSLIGGRSGNRGRCAQPCRLPYDVEWDGRVVNDAVHKYVLSPKDMCTLSLLPQIVEAGVDSLKIEGRMKKPVYTAGVVSIYRKYLDRYLENGGKGYRVEAADLQKLSALFNRNGFSESYYQKKNGPDMIAFRENAFREEDQELSEEIQTRYLKQELKRDLSVSAYLQIGKPLRLEMRSGKVTTEISGDVVQKASTQPILREQVEKQLRKWGNTPFQVEELQTEMEDGCFLSVGQLNAIRRQGQQKLTEEILSGFRRTRNRHNPVLSLKEAEKASLFPMRRDSENIYGTDRIICQVSAKEQWRAALEWDYAGILFVEANAADPVLLAESRRRERVVYYVFPPVFRQAEYTYYEKVWEREGLDDYDGYVIRSLETLDLLRAHTERPVIFDSNLYAWNRRAREVNRRLGAESCVLPLELNYRELLARGCGQDILTIYGHLPVMTTANCIRMNLKGCKKPGTIVLKDRYRNRFPVETNCRFCYNRIYNCQPLVLLGMEHEIRTLRPLAVKLDFTVEDRKRTEQILSAYGQGLEGKPVKNTVSDFTRGHFKRGVE